MSTPEERAKNREKSLEQSLEAIQEAWRILDAAIDHLPDGEVRDRALLWLLQHLLWGTPETIDEDMEWLHKRGLRP